MLRKTVTSTQNQFPRNHCMRKVQLKGRKMKWPLIVDRSCQQNTKQSEKSPSQTEGELTPFRMTPQSHSHTASISFVLCIPAIVLLIVTRIKCLFTINSRESGDANHDLNVFDNEFKLEKSGLNDEYDFDFDFAVLTTITFDIIGAIVNTPAPSFNFTATGVASHEFNNLGYEFNAVLAPAAAVIIVINGKKIKMKYDSGLQQQQQLLRYPIVPVIDKMAPRGIGFCEFNNTGYTFVVLGRRIHDAAGQQQTVTRTIIASVKGGLNEIHDPTRHGILLTIDEKKENKIKNYFNYLQRIIYNGIFDELIEFLCALFLLVLILLFLIMVMESSKLLIIDTFYFEDLKLLEIGRDGDKYHYYLPLLQLIEMTINDNILDVTITIFIKCNCN